MPLVGGVPKLVANGEAIGELVIDGEMLYYATTQGIRRVGKHGDGCMASLSTVSVSKIAVGTKHVYFADGKNIARVPK